MSKKYVAAHILAFITIFIWGTTYISTKLLLNAYTPIEILFFRFAIGYVVLTMLSPKPIKYNGVREELLFVSAGITGITLYFLLENIALTMTRASNVGIITAIAPMITALIAGFVYKTGKPGKQFVLGFAAAMIGIGMISFQGVALEINPFGDLLAVLACMVWAVYSVIMKKISDLDYNTIKVTRKNFRYGLLFMLPVLLFMDFRFGFERLLEPVNLINILYLGLGASAMCFVTWNWALKIMGPVKTSVYIYLIPVITLAFSAVILSEPVTARVLFGAALTILGLYLSQRKEKGAEIEARKEIEETEDPVIEND